MNKERRTKISQIKMSLIETKSKLESVLTEESFSFDSMPENLQGSDRGMESEDAIDAMEEAIEELDNALEKIGEII